MDDWRSTMAFWSLIDPLLDGGEPVPTLYVLAGGARQAKPEQEGNYVKKIRALARLGALPADVGVHHVDIFHDNWCAQLQGHGTCNCDPIVKLKARVPTHRNN